MIIIILSYRYIITFTIPLLQNVRSFRVESLWKQFSGRLMVIEVGSNEIWGCNRYGGIYKKGVDDNWKKTSGSDCIQVNQQNGERYNE